MHHPYAPTPRPFPNPYYGNPLSTGAKVALALVGIGVVGGAVYFGVRAAAKAAVPEPVSPPPGAPIPTPTPPPILHPEEAVGGPSPADRAVLQTWETPTSNVKLIHAPGEVRPYRVVFTNKIELPYKSGDFGLGSEAEARQFALGKAWPLGVPFEETDTLIDYEYTSQGGGGVWQAEDGAYYISWNLRTSSGQEGSFEELDEAKGALAMRLGLEEAPLEAEFADIPPAQAQIIPING